MENPDSIPLDDLNSKQPDRSQNSIGSGSDPSLVQLRQILLQQEVDQIAGLKTTVGRLEEQFSDDKFLVKLIAPILGDAIRLKINEARDELIEALYPIIGKVVQRAVKEGISELARAVDAQAKKAFDFRLAWWRIKARLSGLPEAQIRLRELLPFTVTDVLLINRNDGLLLARISSESSTTSDSDLLSGMLTAIQDFSKDTLGGAEETNIGEISYGDQHILIETSETAYLAVIYSGVAPPGFPAEMRENLREIIKTCSDDRISFVEDSGCPQKAEKLLANLLISEQPKGLSNQQKRLILGSLVGLVGLLAGCFFVFSWIWNLGARIDQLSAAAISSTIATQIPSPFPPTASPIPSATASPSPFPTALPTYTPEASPTLISGVVLGNVWLRSGPSDSSARTGVILSLGERVELLAVQGEWVQVRQITSEEYLAVGWINSRWFGTTEPIPTYPNSPAE